jgi:hypothetical protein
MSTAPLPPLLLLEIFSSGIVPTQRTFDGADDIVSQVALLF